MTAAIVIDDGTNPPVIGSVDRGVGFLSTAFTLSNFDNTGVLGFTWTLIDRPIGSSASLSTPTASTTDLTPDVPGSYLVRLETFQDVAKTIADGVDEQVIGIRFDEPYDWLIPAAGETIQQNPTRGWAEAREESIRDVRQNLSPKPRGPVVTGAHTAKAGELVFYDPTGGSFQIDAPASPTQGDRFAIKNSTTDATSVTIDGNGNNIEDPNTSTLVASFGLAAALVSLDFVFDGTKWLIL